MASAPLLTIACRSGVFTLDPADPVAVVGRRGDAAIRLHYTWLSRINVRISAASGIWVATCVGRAGMFVDGVKLDAVALYDGMTLRLGAADGAPLAISFSRPDQPTWPISDGLYSELTRIDTAMRDAIATDTTEFSRKLRAMLAELRRLQQQASADIAEHPGNAERVAALVAARRRHHELMIVASRIPGAPVGHRLYAARQQATLGIEDIALATGLPVGIINAAEAGLPIPSRAATALDQVVAQLGATTGESRDHREFTALVPG